MKNGGETKEWVKMYGMRGMKREEITGGEDTKEWVKMNGVSGVERE